MGKFVSVDIFHWPPRVREANHPIHIPGPQKIGIPKCRNGADARAYIESKYGEFHPDYCRVIHDGEVVRRCGSHYGPQEALYQVMDWFDVYTRYREAMVYDKLTPKLDEEYNHLRLTCNINEHLNGTWSFVFFKRARASHRRKVVACFTIITLMKHNEYCLQEELLSHRDVWFGVNENRETLALGIRGIIPRAHFERQRNPLADL